MCKEAEIMEGTVFENQATVYEDSSQSVRSELNLFELPVTDVTTQYTSDFMQVFPMTSLRQAFSPLEFQFSAEGSSYLDLANSFLHLVCRIVRQDGTPLLPTDDVAPCNNFFHNAFSNLQIYCNGTLISDAGNFYPTIANIQRLLSTNSLQKETELTNELYYPDLMPGRYDKSDQKRNPGYFARHALSNKSQQFAMLGKFVANVFTQSRYFPPSAEFRITLRRNLPELCINSKVTSLPGFNGCPWRFGRFQRISSNGLKKLTIKKIIVLQILMRLYCSWRGRQYPLL